MSNKITNGILWGCALLMAGILAWVSRSVPLQVISLSNIQPSELVHQKTLFTATATFNKPVPNATGYMELENGSFLFFDQAHGNEYQLKVFMDFDSNKGRMHYLDINSFEKALPLKPKRFVVQNEWERKP